MKVERTGKRMIWGEMLPYKRMKAVLSMTAKTLRIKVQRPWVFVELEWKAPPHEGTACGFARCCYLDTFDATRGVAIARGRAVADYAKVLWNNGTKGE